MRWLCSAVAWWDDDLGRLYLRLPRYFALGEVLGKKSHCTAANTGDGGPSGTFHGGP